MGRKPWKHEYEVEDCHKLSILDIKNAGFFGVVRGPVDEITFKCSIDGEERSHTYGLETTKCHFGGLRYWLKCHCGRRVYKLYIPPGEDVFKCRSCHNLTYNSRKREHPARMWKGILRIIQ